MRTKFYGTQIAPKYILVRVEVKHMLRLWYYFSQPDLVNKYGDISFARFVEYVIAQAKRNMCFDRSSPCSIDEHFRQVLKRSFQEEQKKIHSAFAGPISTHVVTAIINSMSSDI